MRECGAEKASTKTHKSPPAIERLDLSRWKIRLCVQQPPLYYIIKGIAAALL